MNTKQIILLTTTLGFMATITLANDRTTILANNQTTDRHIPAYIHYEKYPRYDSDCSMSEYYKSILRDRASKLLKQNVLSYTIKTGFYPKEENCALLYVAVAKNDTSELDSIVEKAEAKYIYMKNPH